MRKTVAVAVMKVGRVLEGTGDGGKKSSENLKAELGFKMRGSVRQGGG